jgi:glucose/arabinose dehydrogenase
MKCQKKNYIHKIFSVLVLLSIGLQNSPVLADTVQTKVGSLYLPKPFQSKSTTNFTDVIGWPDGLAPVAPSGLKVTKFAGDLINPRNIYVGPNGDIFISEANTEVHGIAKFFAWLIGATKADRLDKSANRITMFRDSNRDGVPDSRSTFLSGLHQPFGMLIIGNYFYVANTDSVWRYPYKTGDTVISQPGEKIHDLPGKGRHWTRNLLASGDGSKIYISVGSSSNVAENGIEKEIRRADILQINPDGSAEKIFASGLRNPVGIAWEPLTKTLWASVNERDELGDDLVPDYLASVKDGGFYGWPFSYYGGNIDPRIKPKDQRPDLVSSAIMPEVPLGAHTASLGLLFYKGDMLPEKYRNGAFITQHGSWNRSKPAGFKVIFVPFRNGNPTEKPEDFLTGFVADPLKNKVYGRPTMVAELADGSLLVSDDKSNIIWRVSKE